MGNVDRDRWTVFFAALVLPLLLVVAGYPAGARAQSTPPLERELTAAAGAPARTHPSADREAGTPTPASSARSWQTAPACNRHRRWFEAAAVIAGAVVANVFLTRHLRREAPCDNCTVAAPAGGSARSLAAVGQGPSPATGTGLARPIGSIAAGAGAPILAEIETDPATAGPMGPQCMSNRRFWTITGVAISVGTGLNILLSHTFRKKCTPSLGGPFC